MMFDGINLFVVGVVVVVFFIIGVVWYGVFGKVWMKVVDLSEE